MSKCIYGMSECRSRNSIELLSNFWTIRCARIKMDYYMHSSLLNTYGFVLANCRYEWWSGFSHCPHIHIEWDAMCCVLGKYRPHIHKEWHALCCVFGKYRRFFRCSPDSQKNTPFCIAIQKISAGMPHSWNTCDGSVSKCPMHEWIVENLSIFQTIRSARIKMDFYKHSSSMHTYRFILANCR